MVDPREAKEAKKYVLPGYLQRNVLQSEPAMDESIMKLLAWMDKFFTYTAFDITGEVIFSQPFGFLEKGEDLHGSIAMVWGVEAYITFVGYFQWIHRLLSNPFTTWLGILPMGHIYDTTMAALSERQKNSDARFDLAAHWFQGLERAKKEGSKIFDLRCLQAFASSNVTAASETVSAGLQSFVYHLLRQPDGWQRIRDEIEAARKDGRCEREIISYEDAVALPYLQAAVKEVGFPRVASKGGVTIGDTTFPEGVTLSINTWVIHHSKEFWGPDAREFKPERWLQDDIASKEKYFIPWGAGYTSCPGQTIAKMQLFKIAASIVRDYDIRQVDPNKEWKWAAHFTAIPWVQYIGRDYLVRTKRHRKSEWRVLTSQTIGVEFASKIIKVGTGARRKRIKLQLWDTAGTERFRSVSRSYYRGAAGAVLVYDVTSHDSFRGLQPFLNDARALASPNLTTILVGNKLDLANDGNLIDLPPPTPSSTSSSIPPYGTTPTSTTLGTQMRATIAPEGREISAAEASRWAGGLQIPVTMEVSAFSGEGVDEVFGRLARMILTKIELGEIDPDDPMSGIQYGDGGMWNAGASDGASIKSGMTADSAVIGGVRRRRGRGGKRSQNWGGMREWEDVFTLSRGRGRGNCC
ncbi:putative ras family gtpase protein [Eutypa lata UCREL1]|uniref:Putative ras family gtpase protein n=1 Tax=Eutypa lata (strain UCR-EL1) TaxID=1287681 RepID=M7SMT0_EUTLA|nr:putative ras family gtpase protein [Eutypa lata UCREL1]